MSQTFNMPPAGTDKIGPFLRTTLPDALQALLSLNSGTAEPTYPVAYCLWADTTAGWLKMRNAANSDWIIVGPLGGIGRFAQRVEFLSLSATTRRRVLVATNGATIERVTLLSAGATTGSSGANEWRVKLYNETAALDLFSGNVGTGTALGGVGGGAELAANVPFVLTANQNKTLAAAAVLSLELTKVGAPTSPLTEVVAIVEGFRRA